MVTEVSDLTVKVVNASPADPKRAGLGSAIATTEGDAVVALVVAEAGKIVYITIGGESALVNATFCFYLESCKTSQRRRTTRARSHQKRRRRSDEVPW